MPIESDSKNKIFPIRVVRPDSTLPRVLLIDDSETSRKMLPWLLKDEFEVFTAENWSIGFPMFMREKISILLLDVEMPGFTGDQIARQIRRVIDRRAKMGQRIVVAYYSGSEEADVAELTTNTQVQGYVLKTWSRDELIRALHDMISCPA